MGFDFHFERLCRILADSYGFKPNEVADMTPYQVEMMLNKEGETKRISWWEAKQLMKGSGNG